MPRTQKQKPQRDMDPRRAIELTTCGDTGEYGGIVWFGTQNERGAVRKLHRLARVLPMRGFKKFPKPVKR